MIKYLASILFVSLVFIPALSFWAGSQIDRQWYLQGEFFLLLFAIFLMFIMHIIIFGTAIRSHVSVNFGYSDVRLFQIIVIYFLFAQIGFGLNLSRVFTSGISFGNGRSYELIFGRYTLINYLYFINGFIVSSYLVLKKYLVKKLHRKLLKAMFICSFLSLFFHGVKGTIIFPIFALFFSYILINKSFPIRFFIVVVLSIPAVFVLNFYLRSGDEVFIDLVPFVLKKIVLYLSPAFSNLQLELEKPSQYSGGVYTFGVFITIVNFVANGFSKSTRFDPGTNSLTGHEMQLVSDAYNTGTIFREAYYDFSFFGIYFYVYVLSFFMAYLYRRFQFSKSIVSIYVLSLFSVSFLFIFWGNHFVRIQYFYWIFLAIFIHLISKRKKYYEK